MVMVSHSLPINLCKILALLSLQPPARLLLVSLKPCLLQAEGVQFTQTFLTW